MWEYHYFLGLVYHFLRPPAEVHHRAHISYFFPNVAEFFRAGSKNVSFSLPSGGRLTACVVTEEEKVRSQWRSERPRCPRKWSGIWQRVGDVEGVLRQRAWTGRTGFLLVNRLRRYQVFIMTMYRNEGNHELIIYSPEVSVIKSSITFSTSPASMQIPLAVAPGSRDLLCCETCNDGQGSLSGGTIPSLKRTRLLSALLSFHVKVTCGLGSIVPRRTSNSHEESL